LPRGRKWFLNVCAELALLGLAQLDVQDIHQELDGAPLQVWNMIYEYILSEKVGKMQDAHYDIFEQFRRESYSFTLPIFMVCWRWKR